MAGIRMAAVTTITAEASPCRPFDRPANRPLDLLDDTMQPPAAMDRTPVNYLGPASADRGFGPR